MMFVFGVALLAVLAALVVVMPLARRKRPLAAAIGGVFVAGAATGIYLLIGRPDLGAAPPQALDVSQPRDVVAMVEQLAQRLEAAPEDIEGWTMLGRAYMLMGRYAEAARAFNEALTRTPGEDADLIASFAEARALANPPSLAGEAGGLFERALELDPENPRGLWYGGLAAQMRGELDTALARWQRLIAQGLPAEFRQVVEARITAIDPAAVNALLSVTVDVAPEVADALPPGGVLYVFLREAGASPDAGPPLAARRLPYFQLPETLPLTRQDLLRGDALPEGPFTVTARLSADGDPAPGEGDIEGSASWRPQEGASVQLRLDTRR